MLSDRLEALILAMAFDRVETFLLPVLRNDLYRQSVTNQSFIIRTHE